MLGMCALRKSSGRLGVLESEESAHPVRAIKDKVTMDNTTAKHLVNEATIFGQVLTNPSPLSSHVQLLPELSSALLILLIHPSVLRHVRIRVA